MKNRDDSKGNKHLTGGLIALALMGGGFFLWGEYKPQIIAMLPYLILLLCPLMHLFMHRGHGGHK